MEVKFFFFVVVVVFSMCILFPFSSAKSTDFHYCNEKTNYAIKVSGVDITPYPVKAGKESTFSIAATTDDSISGGKLIIDVKYLFLHVHQETHDICKETSCPVSGDFVLSHSQVLPGIAPPENFGGYMVAFAGRKYAARSLPAFVANGTFTVTSFTLVHEFKKGRLENLYWKRDGCASCSGNSNFVCLNGQDCAIRTNNCKNRGGGGNVDCSLGIQLTFSGTDKHESVFNSWFEVKNLRQYSLYGLYSNLRSSLTDQYNKFF